MKRRFFAILSVLSLLLLLAIVASYRSKRGRDRKIEAGKIGRREMGQPENGSP